MENFEAIQVAEGIIEPNNQEHYFEAWQHLIDTGLAWSLQGHFGRTAIRLIESGHCRDRRQNDG